MPPPIAFVDQRFRVRSRRETCDSRSNGRSVWGFYSGDRPLAANEEPPLGAHLITPRFAYTHHGVYVGAGTVVHYGAFAYHWRRGPVEEISLSGFAHGHPVWVRSAGPDALRCEEIVRRARSRLALPTIQRMQASNGLVGDSRSPHEVARHREGYWG